MDQQNLRVRKYFEHKKEDEVFHSSLTKQQRLAVCSLCKSESSSFLLPLGDFRQQRPHRTGCLIWILRKDGVHNSENATKRVKMRQTTVALPACACALDFSTFLCRSRSYDDDDDDDDDDDGRRRRRRLRERYETMQNDVPAIHVR